MLIKSLIISPIQPLLVILVFRHFAVEPLHHVCHLSVDTKLARTGTSITPAGGAMQIELPASLTHHRSPTIPLTGVFSSLVQACADHGVMDLSWVGFITASTTDHRDLDLLKLVWSGASGSKSTPARDPAFGTVSWCGKAALGQTHQIHVPEDQG